MELLIYGNPADTIEGPIREERDPSILLKTEYKALLQVAGGNKPRQRILYAGAELNRLYPECSISMSNHAV
jgi:hypothetical protein